MSLYAARNIPLFAIIVTPIVLRQLQAMVHRSESRPVKLFQEHAKSFALADASARGHLWPIISIAGVCALGLSGKITFDFDPAKKPVAAVEFLKREKLSGRMFNADEFGDYVIYAAWPQYRVFLDGRFDMYGQTWFSQYVTVVTIQPGWEKVIEKNNFAWIFCGAETPLSMVLMENKNWHLLYADKVAHIFVKNIPENRLVISKYPKVKPEEPKQSNQE